MIKLLFILMLIPSIAWGALLPYPFPFTGRWQLAEDPTLIDQFGFQDIQNVRKVGKYFQGVGGFSRINQDSDISNGAGYTKGRAGFHFKKDNPSETHVIVQTYDSDESASKLYQNKTAIPNTGEFEATAIHTDAAGAEIGRFSYAPQGNVVYCNQAESLIWGGDERSIHGFLVQTGVTTTADGWDVVWDNDSDTYSVVSGNTFYIGSTRRIDRFKLYVKTANASAGTMQVRQWQGWSWVPVSTLVDGTASGGVPIAETGTVTFDYSEDSRTTFVLNDDTLIYWYQVYVPGLDATTALYYVTVGEGGFRPIENIWDGTLAFAPKVWYKSVSGVSDITDYMAEDPPEVYYYKDISGMRPQDYILVGSLEKLRGFEIGFVDGMKNTNVSGISVQYYNGTWSGVTGLYDGLKVDDKTCAQNGRIHFLPTEEWGTDIVESKTTGFSNEAVLYYYKIFPDATLSTVAAGNDVQIYYIRGIPAQTAKGDRKDLGNYRFPILFQNRLLLFCEENEGNKVIYSAFNAPDVFNGDDSGELYFGDFTDISAAAITYNVFRTSGFEQLIVTKGNETYRMYGAWPTNSIYLWTSSSSSLSGGDTWTIQKISSNIGCAAPRSMTVCESTDVGADVQRNVAIWQASTGAVKCDGATIQDISKDISNYWDKNDSLGISPRQIDDTESWYDPDLNSYKVLLSSGAEVNDAWGGDDIWDDQEDWGIDWENAVNDHNVELEYSLSFREWTKLYRENVDGALPLQTGWQVYDSDNKTYTYGAADDGYMYRLEDTNTWNKTPIAQYLRTGDLMLSEQNKPFFLHTRIDYMRLIWKNKNFQSGESIVVTHYCDGIESTTGTSDYDIPNDINMGYGSMNTQDCFMGPCLRHSLKFSASTSNVDDGMELIGLGLYYDYYEALLDIEGM